MLKRMGRLLEAEAVLRRAHDLFGHDRPEAYYRLTNQLGRVVEELGREEEALGLYYESLDGLKGAWGSNQVKRNIALTLAGLGRLEESRDLLEETLSSEDAMPVRDEGFIAWIIRPLAVAHRALGNNARADELYSRLADLQQPWVS